MRTIKQSAAYNLMIFMTSSTDHITGKTGLTGVTLQIAASKAGAAFNPITPTVTERGVGWYSLALTSSHTDTLGDLALNVTGSGADPTDVALQVSSYVEIADAVFTRDTSAWEASAPVKSLGTAVMKATHKIAPSGTDLQIYRSNGSTVHAKQALVTNSALEPIEEVGGSTAP